VTAGSRCYAAGYSDVPQFFKAKLTDDGRRRQSSVTALVLSRSRRPAERDGEREDNPDESTGNSSRTSSPFGERVPVVPVVLTLPRRSVSRLIPHACERTIAFSGIHHGTPLSFLSLSHSIASTPGDRTCRNIAIWLGGDPSPIIPAEFRRIYRI
jgi:hypothetical protein